MIVLALATGVYTYVTDANLRSSTLFEVVGSWEEKSEPVIGLSRSNIPESNTP